MNLSSQVNKNALSKTTFHLQKPHFSKASIAIIDMPTFSIIYIHHTTIKLEIATAKQWNSAIRSCSPKTWTSKSDITLHSISNRIFLQSVYGQSAKSFACFVTEWSTLSLLKYPCLLKTLKSSTSYSKTASLFCVTLSQSPTAATPTTNNPKFQLKGNKC